MTKTNMLKCFHQGCSRSKLISKDNPKTPKGVYYCNKCGCLYRLVKVGKDKTLALVTRNNECYTKEFSDIIKRIEELQKNKKQKKKK